VAFLETADFSSHVWTLNTGSAYGADAVSRDPHALRLESNNGGGANASVLFQTAFSPKVWHNFAVQIDFEHRYALLRRGGGGETWILADRRDSVLAAWYSTGKSSLKQVVGNTENDSTGKGQCELHYLSIYAPR